MLENITVSSYSQITEEIIEAVDNCSDVIIDQEIQNVGIIGDGDCGQFRTQTPGGWGASANEGNPGLYRDAHFQAAFPNGLTIGCVNQLSFTSAAAIEDFLPSAGTADVLLSSAENPVNIQNSLAGHLVALSLSIGFDAYDADFSESEFALKDLLLNSGPFNGWSVENIVTLANDVLGGCNASYSPSEVADALSLINENFVDGEIDNGNLLCVSSTGECDEIYVVSYTATDDCGNSSVIYQIIEVIGAEAFVFADCPENIEVECDQIPDASSVTYFSSCTEEEIAVFSEEIELGICSGSYEIIRTWTAINSLGEEFTCTQIISVVDETPPVFINAPEDVTVSCGDVPEAQIEAYDNCSETDVVVQVVENQLSGGCFPVLLRTFIAEDDCGNVSSHTQYITVVDSESPEVLNSPENLTLNCGELIPDYIPLAQDNCATEFTIEYAENQTDFDCGYQLEQVWTVIDDCYNSTAVTRIITFEDNSAPQLVSSLEPIQLECGEEIPLAEFSDDCSQGLEVQLIEPNLSSCNESFEITFVVTDNCGNSAEFLQSVTRIDSAPPVFLEMENEINVSCGGLEDIESPEVLDCNEVSLSYADDYLSGDGCPVIIRTWMAEDACGNQATAIQNITLTDDEAPIFLSNPLDINTTCTNLSEPINPPVTDNCDDDVTIDFSEESTEITCGLELVRTWVATDDCGNQSVVNQLVTIIDESAPTISGDEQITANCGAEIESLITVEDDCSNFIEVSFEEETLSESPCERSVQRIYTATDLCGNSATFNQLIFFVDDQAPLILGLEDLNYQCTSDILDAQIIDVSDNCSGVTVSYSDEEEQLDCGVRIVRTWEAIDECGNVSFETQVIEAIDDQAPQFLNTVSDLSLTCGDPIPAPEEVFAEDNCSNVNIEFNEVTETGNCAASYVIVRTWSASDDCGNTSSLSQIIEVSDSTPPVFNESPADVVASCGDELIIPEVTATDECGGEVSIEFSQQTSPGGCPNIFRTWVATDLCGNQSTLIQTVFIEDNEPPFIEDIEFEMTATCENVPDIPVPFVSDNCDDNVNVTVSESVSGTGCEQVLIRMWIATDDCGNTTIATQSIHLIDEAPPIFINPIEDNAIECEDIDSLPLPQVQDNCGGDVDISFTDEIIAEGCEAEILRTYTATDLCGNSSTFDQTIHIIDLSPPSFTGVLAGTFVDCGSIPPAITPVVFDACNSTDIDVVFNEQQLGEGCSYTLLRTWVATDACGNSATASRYIFVQDSSAPEFSNTPVDQMLTCGANLPPVEDVSAIDNCSDEVQVTYSEELVTDECGTTSYRTWRAVDDCGNEALQTQTISIVDQEAPVLENVPADISVDCMDLPLPLAVTATDNCDDFPEISFSEEVIPGTCPYNIIRTWTATDNCGNTVSNSQTITVSDDIAPEFDLLPENISISCGELQEPFQITATDNCTAIPEIEYSEELMGGDCVRTLYRTWIAVDHCGNYVEHTQEITLLDEEAPTVGEYEDELYFECNEEFRLPEVEFFDDCSEIIELYEEEYVYGICNSTYDIQRAWLVTDNCGNELHVSQVIHIVDTSLPVLNITSEEITVSCSEIPDTPAISVFGECADYETEFTEEIEFLEDLDDTCELGNAVSLNGDVSIWLPDLSSDGADFVFGSEPGVFAADHGSGVITITGQVYNVNNPNQSWLLNLQLYDRQTWSEWSENGGEYKDDLGVAGDNYLDWNFYKLSDQSQLIGAGEFEGSELNLTHTPADYTYGFQIGVGANNRNGEYGISGWFFYEGTLNGDYTYGFGDLIAEIKCCPDQDITRTWTVEDCAGNMTSVTQIIHVRENLQLSELSLSEINEAQFDVLNTEGDEFVIFFDSGDDVSKTLIITDLSGRIVYEVEYPGLEKNTTYVRRISKGEYLTGIYMFYLRGRTSSNSDMELNIK